MTAPITREQPPFGTLTWDDSVDWWVSDALPIALFGGSPMTISFEIGDSAPAAIPATMLEAARAMLQLSSSALEAITPHVWENYRAFRDAVGPDDVEVIAPSDDIWAHVQPSTAMVEERDGVVYVSFECNCDWEIEHGLMLVLQNGVRWVKVSAYDGHVTDGHAYAKPLLNAWMDDPAAVLPIRTWDEIDATPGGPKRR